jgi:2-C-methyl-D-erythritol 4-phosphate cytidylyltransferase
MRHIAIVLAAGRGKRMNSAVAKQYLMIHDKPVLYYALKQFENSFIDDMILVTGEEEIAYCQEEIVAKYGFTKVRKVIAGGKERYHSVHQGLAAAKELLNAEEACIYIHDGARPLITEEILTRAKASVEQYGSGVVGMPVKDTIKIVDEDCFAVQTPKRSLVWQMQTPQCFLFSKIMPAYSFLIEKEVELLDQGISITDDAMVMELYDGSRVKLVEGSYSNIKITTPEDLGVAERFLENDTL